jgi:hypothetical protein
MIRLTANNKIAKAKNYYYLKDIKDTPKIQKPKPIKNPFKVIFKKDLKPARELSINNLTNIIQKLQVNLINTIKDLIKGYIEILNT